MFLTHEYSRVARLPHGRNILRGVPTTSVPYSVRTALQALGLWVKRAWLSANQIATYLQTYAQQVEDATGRTPTEIIRDLNEWSTGSRKTGAGYNTSIQVKEKYSDKKSWWVTPTAEIINAGWSHDQYLEDHRDEFRPQGIRHSRDAIGRGWVRVGCWGGRFYVDTWEMSSSQLRAVQEIYLSLGSVIPVETVVRGSGIKNFTGLEFLTLKYPAQLKNRNRENTTNYANE